jgi:Terminase small subunit
MIIIPPIDSEPVLEPERGSQMSPVPAGTVDEIDPLSDGVDAPGDRTKDDEGLTRRQRAFVEALISNGGTKRAAAESAGYASGDGASVAASRALNLPQVQDAIIRRLKRQRVQHSIGALRVLARLAFMGRSEYVRLEAATRLLDGALEDHKGAGRGHVRIDIDLG